MKTMKLGSQTGSLVNHVMSGSKENVPVVGKGATILMWSDRHAYEVLEVAEDGKSCIIQKYKPERIDENGMSDAQSYKFEELEGGKIKLVLFRGNWCQIEHHVTWIEPLGNLDFKRQRELHEEYKSKGGEYGEFHPVMITVVEGLTRKAKRYHKQNIKFGFKSEYYDFSF